MCARAKIINANSTKRAGQGGERVDDTKETRNVANTGMLTEFLLRFFMHYVFSDTLFQHRVRVDKSEG